MIDYDFSFYLSLATLITGLVWLLDAFLLAPKRLALAGVESGAEENADSDSSDSVPEPWYVEYSKSFFPVLLFVLVLRSFIAEPFRIPSGSMLPTLEVGDFILVNKFSYGLRWPVFNNKFIEIGEPQRGDVVVFRFPEDPRIDYIKRVVGLPGDRIEYIDKQLVINGNPVALEFVEPYDRIIIRGGGVSRVYTEKLPNKEHAILLYPRVRSPFQDSVEVVPDGHYFVMGDNRDDSRDSRAWGFLPEKNLVGKAFFVWMHYDFGGDGFELDRIGLKIR